MKSRLVDFPAPSPPSSVMNFAELLFFFITSGSTDNLLDAAVDSVSHFFCAR